MHPSRFRTAESANHSNLAENAQYYIGVVACVVVFAAFLGGARFFAWRRTLRAGPWQIWNAGFTSLGGWLVSSHGLPIGSPYPFVLPGSEGQYDRWRGRFGPRPPRRWMGRR